MSKPNFSAVAGYQVVFSAPPGSGWIMPAELLTAGLLAGLFAVLTLWTRRVLGLTL